MYYPPPPPPFLRPQCAQHPEREAIGICIVCRRPICTECSTPIDGINRCAACVAALAPAAEFEATSSRDDSGELRGGNLFALLFFGGMVFLLALGATYCGGG
ncbi:MAG TPA: hypothetical protein VGQ83_11175 [Polyangia bacterium]|jgi:hypothetical protein